MLFAERTTEQAAIREKLPGLEQRINKLQRSIANVAQLIEKAKRYGDLTRLAPEILGLFIEKMAVGERRRNIPAPPNRKSGIYYQDIGLMDKPAKQPCETARQSGKQQILAALHADLIA